jgi:hypothetical protein
MGNETNAVGYKKPPMANRFKPGRSGNPSGRPKKSKNVAAEVLDELAESISLGPGNASATITRARAIAKTLVDKAIGGNLRAISLLLTCPGTSRDGDDEHADQTTAADEKIVAEFLERKLKHRDSDETPLTKPKPQTQE